MSERKRARGPGWPALLLALLGLALASAPLAAQTCPTQTITINRPATSGTNLCGTIRVDISLSAPPAGWSQGTVTCLIEDLVGGIYEQGLCYTISPTTYAYVFDSTLLKNAFYQVVVKTSLVNQSTQQSCPQQNSSPPTFNVSNPGSVRAVSRAKMRGAFTRNPVPTGSSTDPQTGDESFIVPVSQWQYQGATIPFFLEYDSVGMTDPQQPAEPNFSGLSDRNSHFWHPFAQWIDLAVDDTHTGAPTSAVWHHGNSTLYFVSGPMNTWSPPDSYHSLMGDGVDPQESVTCTVNGMPMTEPVPVANSAFTLTDADHTTYQFGGTGHLYWQVNGCMALPHYLLASITDRWQRKLTITWGTPSGTTEPRVMSVADSTGNGLAFAYAGDLIQTIQDPQGRVHRLTYNPVLAEDGNNYGKLTGVQVMGPGDTTRTTYNWSFSYQDPNDPQSLAYGGTYTGDLVIHKTDPAQVTENFFYEPISLAGGSTPRLREEDWDGRLAKVQWSDTDGSTREIDRASFDSTNSQDTLTFFTTPGDPYLPGGIPVRYTFDGFNNTTAVTDVLTGRTWSYGFDTAGGDQSRVHNLTSVNTPLEPAGTTPLVHYDYGYSGSDQITLVTEKVLQDAAHGGGLGDPVDIHFNSLHLPYQITAHSRDGLHDQTTLFWFDGFMDGTSGMVGNLTTLIEASGQMEAQTTTFSYLGAAGAWGLPDSMTNPVGGTSSFGYDTGGLHPSGRLLTAASPVNMLYPMGDASHDASVTTLMYNQDGLPSLVQDPMGHQIGIGYNAPSAGSGNLVISITRIATPSLPARQITLDPRGRVILDQDEMGVQTVQTWNAEDQLLSVTRAANYAGEAATTTLHYNAQDDLDYLDPPNGSAGRVKFEYGRYLLVNQGVPNQEMVQHDGTYEGQVTRIVYPPTPSDNMQGTSEYLFYNNAGELAYRKKADGSLAIVIGRDVLHRITSLKYPASAVDTGFTTTVQFDEFGRPSTTTDRRGTTTLVWDNLNRISKVMPPAPQHEVDYSYHPDNGPDPKMPQLTLHRWRTQVSLPDLVTGGVIPSFYEYQEDNKGALAAVVSPFNQTTTLHTDLDGKNIETDLPNGTRELRGYLEPEDWLNSIQINKQNGMTLDQLTYSYVNSMSQLDATGHLQSETSMGNQVHAFAYNHRYELIQELSPDLGMVGYGYDLNGNRTSRTDSHGVDDYVLDANNKLEWVNRGTMAMPMSGQASPYMLFGYDPNGNTTHRERRFNDGGFQSFDLYSDGADNLRAIWQHGGSQVYAAAYNGDNLLVSMQDTAGGSFPTQHEYTWGLGGLLYDLYQNAVYTPGLSQNLAGTDSFFHADWLGSTRYLTDSTGNNTTAALRYDAFGARTDTNPTYTPTPFQFAGGWGYQSSFASGPEAGTGLQYLQQRYYDPWVGRFTAPDPISFLGGLNLYAYADNDPVNEVDPEGLAGRGVPDPFDLDAPSSEFVADPTSRPFLRGASQVGRAGRQTIEFVGSFNEVTNVGLAANDIQSHHYGSAFLRLLGPLLNVASVVTGGGWLRAFHEGPNLGHTFQHLHVAATDAELIARLASSKISAASTFLDEASAEASISRAIAANRAEIRLWLRGGATKPLPIQYFGTEVIGRGIAQGEAAVGPRTNVLVVLRSNGKGGFFIRTAYPF